jgi:hypothetical protein
VNDLIDDRIRAALSAQAEQLTEHDLRPDWPPRTNQRRTTRGRGRRAEWLAPVLAAAAVIAIAAATAGVVIANRSEPAQPAHPSISGPPLPSTPLPSAATASPSPTTSAPGQTSASLSPGTSSPPPSAETFNLGYLPLWPFATRAAVVAWEQAAPGGHQPWHLDGDQTALAFTQGYLGFPQFDLVTSSRTDSDGAHVGVGYRDLNGQLHTAAVLRLVRFGPENDAPWEVVNSDDTTFSLQRPPYGSTITSPVTVGGHITGVDENIRVVIRAGITGTVLGQACCTPAGGNNQAWSESVSFSGSGVATIVATTGGHLQQIERFTIQGVRL